MKNKTISIEITSVDRVGVHIDSIEGILSYNNISECIFFEILRLGANKSGELNLRIYNKYSETVLVPEFKGKFYSCDFDNRKMIKWLGINAKNLIMKKYYE